MKNITHSLCIPVTYPLIFGIKHYRIIFILVTLVQYILCYDTIKAYTMLALRAHILHNFMVVIMQCCSQDLHTKLLLIALFGVYVWLCVWICESVRKTWRMWD